MDEDASLRVAFRMAVACDVRTLVDDEHLDGESFDEFPSQDRAGKPGSNNNVVV
jgi:hypothetical protein